MIVCSPDGTTIIDTKDYKYIHACEKNKTHIDFYKEPPVPGERGQPTVIFAFKSRDARDAGFDKLCLHLEIQYL